MKTRIILLITLLGCSILIAETDMYPQSDSLDTLTISKYRRIYEVYSSQSSDQFFPKIQIGFIPLLPGFLRIEDIQDSEMYQISQEMYETYYKNDILLWNFKNSAYLSLNLKHLQSHRGLIQLRIPLSNFSNLYKQDVYAIKRSRLFNP